MLPKYGFPVDVIELELPVGDRNKDNLNLERDLRIGLYEYAPGQMVFADKHCYLSTEKFHYHGIWHPEAKQCPICFQIFFDHDMNNCPNCGGLTIDLPADLMFCRPEAFVAKHGKENGFPEKRGLSQQIYVGDVRGKENVESLNLSVGESDTQMMRYINAGPDGNGFNDSKDNSCIFYHEIITNIAIWDIPANAIPAFKNNLRAVNAVLSAMYAIREAAAIKLRVSSRDIGALLQPQQQDGSYRIILFDQASGGGGLVLPLYNSENKDLIQGILKKAKELCVNCSCCGFSEQIPDIGIMPVSEAEFLNNQAEFLNNQQGDIVSRPKAACPLCLKKQDNTLDHHKLDRWDAAMVIDKILNPPDPPDQKNWTDIPEGYQFKIGRPYRLDDGTVIIWNPRMHPEQDDLKPRIRQYIINN